MTTNAETDNPQSGPLSAAECVLAALELEAQLRAGPYAGLQPARLQLQRAEELTVIFSCEAYVYQHWRRVEEGKWWARRLDREAALALLEAQWTTVTLTEAGEGAVG